MQTHSAAKKKTALMRPVHPQSGWTYSVWTGLILSSLLLLVGGAAVLYFAWDWMPARVQYLPRYIQANFLPERPHPDFVPTPEGVVAPEEALANLQITPAVEAPAAASVPRAAGAAPTALAEAAPAAPAAEAPTTDELLQPVSEPAAEPAPAPPPYALPGPAAQLTGGRHEYQGWNNCGPATLGMQLSFFGRADTQAQTAPFLKPDQDDKNVSPGEMAAYAHSIGFGAQVVVGGDLELLRTLVANGFPVVVESWFIPEPNDEMGHYLLLTGFDGETLIFYDSYHGPNVTENAAEFDALWKVFNRTAVVVWPPDRAELATAILGERADQQKMFERALATAHAEANANPQDRYAWFNLGTNLLALGDVASAVQAFDTARSLQLPWRMLWYQFGPYEAYFRDGQYQEVIGLATTTLNSAGNLEESLYWRGRAHAALGDTEAARRDFQQALRFNGRFAPAQEALNGLP